jgi:hypothetical protein
MTDMTQNMSAYKDPKVFVPFMNAVTEPSFYTAMGLNMMDPGNWLNMANSMTQPGVYSNVAAFADPNVYMKWLAASLDPNFYTALLTQLSDPGKLMRWAMSPLDPKVMQMLMKTIDPNMYVKWMMSPLDPRSLQLMTAPVNPNLYMGWLGASMNPGSYGDMWKGFLNPAGYTAARHADCHRDPLGRSCWRRTDGQPVRSERSDPDVPGSGRWSALRFPFPLPTLPTGSGRSVIRLIAIKNGCFGSRFFSSRCYLTKPKYQARIIHAAKAFPADHLPESPRPL